MNKDDVEYEFVDNGEPISVEPIQPAKKEKKKKKKPNLPPVSKEPPSSPSLDWKGIVIAVLLLLYAHAIYNVVQYHYRSQRLYYDQQIIYPLRLQRGYNTTSVKLSPKEAQSRTLETLFAQLQLHLSHNPEYIVLCTHHLFLPASLGPYVRACTLYNNKRGEYINMVNPYIIGNSRQTKTYREQSVLHANDTLRERYLQIVLEWYNHHVGTDIYSVFAERESIALQLVLDEFAG